MILCEFTPSGGSLVRMSLEDRPMTYQWYSYLQSVSSVKFSLDEQWGGYAKPTFSDITLTPEYFETGTWPPPQSASVVLKWTDGDESDAVTLFDGAALLDYYDRNGISYNLTQPEFSAVVSAGTVFSDTLDNVMTTLCGASYLNLTLNTDGARDTSPAVSYTVDEDILAIDLAKELCNFFVHSFKIVEGTLYLFDLKKAISTEMIATLEMTTTLQLLGDILELTEFDVFPCSYKTGELYALVSSENGSVSGTYANGSTLKIDKEYCSTANLTTNLSNILEIAQKDLIEITAPITAERPRMLDLVKLVDESTAQPTTTTARIISVIYNFDDEVVVFEAIGVSS